MAANISSRVKRQAINRRSQWSILFVLQVKFLALVVLSGLDLIGAQSKANNDICYITSTPYYICKVLRTSEIEGIQKPIVFLCQDKSDLEPPGYKKCTEYAKAYCSAIIQGSSLVKLQGVAPPRLINECKNKTHMSYSLTYNSIRIVDDASEFVYPTNQVALEEIQLINLYLDMGITGRNKTVSSTNLSQRIKTSGGAKRLSMNGITGGNIEALEFRGPDFEMINGKFKRLKRGAIRVSNNRRFIMENVKFSEGMETGSILIEDYPCDGQIEVRIRDSIDLSKSDANPISFTKPNKSCIKLDLDIVADFTDNKFWPHAPEKILGWFVNHPLEEPGVRISLKLDQIECCLSANRWLFEKLWANARVEFVDVTCSDIGHKFYEHKDQAKMLEYCTRRNVVPIYLILVMVAVIVGILSMIALVVWCRYRRNAKQDEAAAGVSSVTSVHSQPGSSQQEIHSDTGQRSGSVVPSMAMSNTLKATSTAATAASEKSRSHSKRSSSLTRKNPSGSFVSRANPSSSSVSRGQSTQVVDLRGSSSGKRTSRSSSRKRRASQRPVFSGSSQAANKFVTLTLIAVCI